MNFKPVPLMILRSVERASVEGDDGFFRFRNFMDLAGMGLGDGQNMLRRLIRQGYVNRAHNASGLYTTTPQLFMEIERRTEPTGDDDE